MSTPPPSPGLAERLAAIPRQVASQAADNGVPGILVSLLLALLTHLFARLADLAARIQVGDYQPHPSTPRKASSAPRPRHRRKPGQFRWPAAALPAAGEFATQPVTPVAMDSVRAPSARASNAVGGPSRFPNPIIARRRHPPPDRQKAHHKPKSWHVHFVTI